MAAPTGQQKRKHQLTYLAHQVLCVHVLFSVTVHVTFALDYFCSHALFVFTQAKANELELSKHWAQSAATRRQAKMKYGF